MRWQTGEARTIAVWLTAADDTPLTSGSPTITVARVSTNTVVATPTLAALTALPGFWTFPFTAAADDDYVGLVDLGASFTAAQRYVPIDVPVGGWADKLDVATSTRATGADLATLEAAVTGLGSPAQASALTTLATAVGTPAQAAALASLATTVGTPAQAGALSALAAAVGTPAQASALASALATLLLEIDTRATRADVQVTVSSPASVRGEVGP